MREQSLILQPRLFTATQSYKKFISVLAIILALVFVFSSGSFAQDKVSLTSIQKDASKEVWHKLKTTGSVTISYQYVDCGPVEFVLFKIDNASADKVAVSWTYKHFNNGTEATLHPDFAKVNYTVNAGSSLSGGCSSENTKLGVFVREGGLVLMVTDIELADINVSIAQ